MRISLIKNGKIYNTNLPLKISGSFWVEDKDKNNFHRNLININETNGRWCLKSNFETKIVYDGQEREELILEDYMIIELNVNDEEYNYLLCTSPVYDNNSMELDVVDSSQIIIGNGPNNVINYNNPYLFSQHCLLTRANGVWYIKSLDENATFFVNRIVTNEAYLNVGDVIFIMNLRIVICGDYIIVNKPIGLVGINTQVLPIRTPLNIELAPVEIEENSELKVYEKSEYFFRMPRFRAVVEEQEVHIDPPPASEKQDEMPLAYTLGPMITMGLTSMVTGISAINSVSNGTQTLTSALPSLITCGAMLLSMIFWPMVQKSYSKAQKEKREALRIQKYNQYIEERRKYIKELVENQKQSLIENNIPLEECNLIIANRKRNLWERKIEHDDFLKLRIGIGDVDPYVKVIYPEEHFSIVENNLRNVLDKLGEETKVMTDVPVTINLVEKFVTAVIGDKIITRSFMEGLLLRIMTFHSYEDLKIIVMTSEENEDKWKFLKTSPYCTADDKSIRFFATNVDEANQISIYLDNYFQNRKYEDGDVSKVKSYDYKSYQPYFLVITDDFQSVRNIEIIKNILGQNINYGFSLLIVQKRLLGLPNECSTFICVEQNQSGVFENELSKDKQQVFNADFINDLNINEINKMIANIPIELAKDRFSLPDRLGFLEMYNVGKIEQLNPLNRWKNNDPIVSLAAPVGVDSNGELFKLDLHEKFHGPHGLVAGMTGSGKSEFIITYILSMAVNYHPDEVSFVLIDYKGGGLAGAFSNEETGVKIPHLSGTITNLDINDMKRSLASIESELKRRQKIFSDARQKLNESTIDIYKYQKLRREGKLTIPVPHLFIISDEFAELKTQQPEFMEQLISTARIGRSLGVHLILATQKPSGVVDDQIWSNTKFRVCLKVQDKSDSVDMIKCPDAASLHNVGRFYLQVGYNEFFALGQSAYAGVQYQNSEHIKRKVDTNINFINNVGYVIKSVDKEKNVNQEKSNGEELSNIVKYLYDLGKRENIFANQLWLNKILEDIYIEELEQKYNYQASKCNINPIIGEYDDPSTQSQHILTLPLSSEGNTIIYGATGSGKEDLLSTIIYSTIIKHTPEEVNFYIIDMGSETLKTFEKIPHVGNVLLANDIESINNLFRMIKEEIEKRKKLFSEFGGSYISYITSSNKVIPNIIIIINLYEAFDEAYPDLQDEFNSLTREGLKYGIIFIITVSGVNFVRYKLRQNFKQNLVLQLNDENDYSDVVGNTNGLYPSKIKGRGLIKLDNIYEFQSAKYKNNGNNNEFIKNLAVMFNNHYKTKAKGIPILPKIVNFDVVNSSINGLEYVPVGIEKESLEVSSFDFRTKPITIISSLETTAFERFIPEFIKVCKYNKLSLNVIDAEKLFEKEKFDCNYIKDDMDKIFEKIYIYLEKINQIYTSNNYNVSSLSESQDLMVVIVGLSQFKNKLSSDNQDKLEKFMLMTKDIRKVSIVIVDTIDNIKQFEYENWYKTVVSNNHGIWIGDGISDQYTIKLSKNPRSLKEDIGNKFGYAIKKGNPVLIKLLSNITLEEEESIDE